MSTSAASRRPSLRASLALVVLALVAVVLSPINLLGATVTGGETCRSLTPNFRAADTRVAPLTKLDTASTFDVTVAGVGGVPADARTVKINLTATELTAPESFLTMYPAGSTRPGTSNLNPIGQHTSTNGAQPVAVGTNGQITVYNNAGSTHVIVDIVEWCDVHNHDDRYYTQSQVDALVGTGNGTTSPVTHVPFELSMDFDSSRTIGEVGDIQLSLRCFETDPTSPITANRTRATLQARAFSFKPFLTTYQDAVEIYPGGAGVTIERAHGSSTSNQPVQTSFIDRLSGAGAITGEDGSQISFNGDGIQVAFHHKGADCYARGYVTILQPRTTPL